MNTKLLRAVKKYYEWKFLQNGQVAVRNKVTGAVRLYDSIHDYVHHVSYTDILVSSIFANRWHKKKQAIKDKQMKKDEDFWNSL